MIHLYFFLIGTVFASFLGLVIDYTNSNMVVYTKLSPNHSGKRTHSIDRISPHCVVGQCTAEGLGSWFARTSTQASSNYGIDKDGRVGMYVEEKNRSWCTSSNANDQRAITIECASDTKEPYECGISDDHSGRYLIDNAAGLVDGYAKELALGTGEIVGCLDHILNASSPNWGVSRMPSLDRNLLRLALFEMLEVDTVDVSVAIDECEIGRAHV